MKIAPTKDILGMTAVLYSVSQDCFHLETIMEHLNDNIIKTSTKANCSDYVIIGIAENDVKGGEYIELFKALKIKLNQP